MVREYKKTKFEDDLKETYTAEIPIIYVIGLSNAINSIKKVIKFRDVMEQNECKIAILSDNPTIQKENDGYYLEMLTNEVVAMKYRIVLMNHFVKSLEVKETYDLIIIAITGGIISYSRQLIDDFGVTVYCAMKAVRADYVILNIFYGKYTKELWGKLEKQIEYILGERVDAYNMVNCILEIEKSESKKEFCMLEISQEMVQKKLKEIGQKKIYSLEELSEYERLAHDVINKLEEYAEIQEV